MTQSLAPNNLDIVTSRWQLFMDQCRRVSMGNAMRLRDAVPTAFDGSVLTITVPGRQEYQMLLMDRNAAEFVGKLMARVLDRESVRVKFATTAPMAGVGDIK